MELVVAVIVAGVGLLILAPHRDVSRARLTRFARCHRVRVTADNGQTLIGYVATVRRYRHAGLVLGLMVEFGCAGVLGWVAISVRVLVVLAGLLLGCAAGEFAVPAVEDGAGASLRRRVLRDFVPEPVLWLTGASWLLATAYVLFARYRATTTFIDGTSALDAMMTAAVVAAAVVVVTVRRVVARPQPAAASDLIAADDATRRAAVALLAGWTMAFSGVLVAAALDVNPYALNVDHHVLDAAGVVAGVVVPLLGLVVGLRGPARRAVPAGFDSTHA